GVLGHRGLRGGPGGKVSLRHTPAGGRSGSLVLAATAREREQCDGDADGTSHAASFRPPAMHTSICTVNEGTPMRPVRKTFACSRGRSAGYGTRSACSAQYVAVEDRRTVDAAHFPRRRPSGVADA